MSVNSLTSFLRPSTTKVSDKSAVSAISSKVAAALGGDYETQVKAAAASDAESGVYGASFRTVRSAQMQKTVSPDRNKAISQVAAAISSSIKGMDLGESNFRLSGLPYTAKVNKGEDKTTAEIYDESGQVVAKYDSEKGSWSSVSTKEEKEFEEASEKVYRSAYQKVRAGIMAGSRNGPAAGVDVKG